MPGIITHNKVFLESINYLQKGNKRNIYSRSIEALFRSKSFLKAGLFGAIGPNIFDYLPFLRNNYICGSNISYELHTTESEKLLKFMLNSILSYKDQNTEWSSTQRAYFYGLISHLISDSIFHPFVYYWSGFPNTRKKSDLLYFREQYLLFEYNIDMFFNQSFDEDIYKNKLNFTLNDMLPVTGNKIFQSMENAIKIILTDAIKEIYPDLYNKYKLIKDKRNNKSSGFFIFDIMPFFIKLSYKIKRSRNPQLIKFLNFIKKKNLFYSDYLINYPPNSKINSHILNLHKERWFHPTGASGLHYESVKDLLSVSAIRIVAIWEKIEEILYNGRKDTSQIEKEFKINSITGIFGKDFYSMQIQNPVRVRF